MIKMDIQQEPHVITSIDLVSGQQFIMDVGIGIGILYEVLEDMHEVLEDMRKEKPKHFFYNDISE